jgi:transposase, IS5 family
MRERSAFCTIPASSVQSSGGAQNEAICAAAVSDCRPASARLGVVAAGAAHRPGAADITVSAANVAYPTDSGLLATAVGTLVRDGAAVQAAGGATGTVMTTDGRRRGGCE